MLPVFLKPLRERPEDIPYLIDYFLDKKQPPGPARKVILEADVEKLKRMPWPGNVRELEHAIEYLITICDENDLDISLLKNRQPEVIRSFSKATANRDLDAVAAQREKDEQVVILRALERGGSVAGAARELGISRSTLRDKLKKYGIKIEKISEEDVNI